MGEWGIVRSPWLPKLKSPGKKKGERKLVQSKLKNTTGSVCWYSSMTGVEGAQVTSPLPNHLLCYFVITMESCTFVSRYMDLLKTH